jgi:hypothetical protein
MWVLKIFTNSTQCFQQAMIKYSVRFSDPYDWEHDQQQSSSVSEESSGGSPPTEEADENMPFTSEDFAKNELGF